MSRLLARIMLALLMLPLATLVYAMFVVLQLELYGFTRDVTAFFVTNILTGIFVAIYWILLWRRTVRWTRRRVGLTGGAAIACVVVGVVVAIPFTFFEDSFAVFIGGVVAILLWLATTTFIWRESREERAVRVRGRSGESLVCPRCGYNMTGLGQATCPECGTEYTINELLAMQPSREGDDLARQE